MKVYILTAEPYHDNTTIIGVYATLKDAEAAGGGGFSREGYYVDNRNCVAERSSGGCVNDPYFAEDYLIFEFEIEQYDPEAA